MPRKRVVDSALVDAVSQNLFNALPIFRKRLLHMDVIQREFCIPLSHVQVLSLLNDRGSMTVSEISRQLGIAKPNVTPLVDRLIENGYASRSRDSEDRRLVNIVICPDGREKLEQIRTKMAQLVGSWADQLTGGQLRQLNDSLATITRILGATASNE